jgi:hypothetical protein
MRDAGFLFYDVLERSFTSDKIRDIVPVYAKELPSFVLADAVFDMMMQHQQYKYGHVAALLLCTRQLIPGSRSSAKAERIHASYEYGIIAMDIYSFS